MPLIVLLTDFGTRDYFVGVMKGIIVGINPLVNILDLSHEIEPQNVKQASFVLWASRKYFPENTIFVSVVDPGVGSKRKIICGRIGGQIFLAPDNGLLDYIVAETQSAEFYGVTNKNFFNADVSSTFHGRDVFAPVAAYLSQGVSPSDFGNHYVYRTVKPFYRSVRKGKNAGEIVYEDHFGNLVTNFLWDESLVAGRPVLIVNSKTIKDFVRTYSEGQKQKPVCIGGSTGLVEIAVNFGHASRVLRCGPGDKVNLVVK